MATETRTVCDACGRDVDKNAVDVNLYGGGMGFPSAEYNFHEECARKVFQRMEKQLRPEARKF